MRRLLMLSLAMLVAGCGARSTDDWIRQLKDPDLVKQRQAVRELGERASEAERVVPALAEALHDTHGYVRHDAATALAKFGPEARPAVPALIGTLKDREHTVRMATAQALKKIDPDAAARAGVR